jgi:hypothetical protein
MLINSFEARGTNINIAVVDDNKNPIPEAETSVVFYRYHGSETVRKKSDMKGKATISGEIQFDIAVVSHKEGYYESRLDHIEVAKKQIPIYSSFNVANGRYQYADDYSAQLELRKIINPIPMYAFSKEIIIPEMDKPIGYDLIEGDWVDPYGIGKRSDIILMMQGYWNNRKDNSTTLTLTFSNKGDGLILFKRHPTSNLKSPYEAPLEGYQPIKKWHISRKANPDKSNRLANDIVVREFDWNANYIFRIRTEIDEKGKVISALYGKIYGDLEFAGYCEDGSWLKITYYANPNKNDRNLECDWRKNLAKDLKSFENPTAP